MIYLKISNKSWMYGRGDLRKIKETRVNKDTYYGYAKYNFEELSNVEVLVECKKRGITVADIKEIK